MQTAIGYLRVSTREQGRRGFSLESQRRDIKAFGARVVLCVKSWYQDVQTGAGADALLLRRLVWRYAKNNSPSNDSTEGGKVGAVPADRLKARPPVAKRSLQVCAASPKLLPRLRPFLATRSFKAMLNSANVDGSGSPEPPPSIPAKPAAMLSKSASGIVCDNSGTRTIHDRAE